MTMTFDQKMEDKTAVELKFGITIFFPVYNKIIKSMHHNIKLFDYIKDATGEEYKPSTLMSLVEDFNLTSDIMTLLIAGFGVAGVIGRFVKPDSDMDSIRSVYKSMAIKHNDYLDQRKYKYPYDVTSRHIQYRYDCHLNHRDTLNWCAAEIIAGSELPYDDARVLIDTFSKMGLDVHSVAQKLLLLSPVK